MSSTTNDTANPNETSNGEPAVKRAKFDLQGLLDRLKLPGIDTKQLIAGRRKDVEALLSANERAFAMVEELTRKQVDLLTSVMKEWQANLKDVTSDASASEKLSHAASHAEHALAQALASMKEMAEIAARSNADVFATLNKRYHEAVEEVRRSIRRRPE